ncbi:MAG: aldo/keto reductase [Actinomycetia bacterium]|nr:aldo/keto reductase [Actinomycetes bacterium]
MRFITLGKTDIKVSVVGFGAWAIGGWMWGGTDHKKSVRAVETAIDSGINLIDTAPAYGQGLSEKIVGQAIKGKRDKVIIATKCGLVCHIQEGEYFFDYPSGQQVYKCLRPESIRYEVEQSLKKLDIDYIDLYQTHWQDTTTPIEETMATLMDLKKEGKIRAIGASNAALEQLKQYAEFGQLDVDQEKYSLIDTGVEKEILPWCKDNKVTMLAYSPMGQGLLTGKMGPEREFKGDDLRKNGPRFSVENRKIMQNIIDNDFKPVAEKYGLSITQLSVAALISQGGVVALCGARDESQVTENAQAGDSVLEQGDIDKIRQSIASINF